MTTRGIFPAFMRQLRKHWQLQLPALLAMSKALGAMPRASTFYAGQEATTGRHVFLWVQSSVKRPGEFTVNLALCEAIDVPAQIPRFKASFGDRLPGVYRVGELVHGSDKWWCLAQGPVSHGLRWQASSYRDQAVVFDEAIADVTADVTAALEKLGLPNKRMQSDERRGAGPGGARR
jgi:hypothetical protein